MQGLFGLLDWRAVPFPEQNGVQAVLPASEVIPGGHLRQMLPRSGA